MRIEEFWAWFRSNASSLWSRDDETIANQLQKVLSSLDSAISVEVATIAIEGRETKEVIISGSGEKSAAQKVKSIVAAAPQHDCWRFIALKPERGFDFEIDMEGRSVIASELYFDPLVSSTFPELLGILVYCPGDLTLLSNAAELMKVIIETGVGEEAASGIAAIKIEAGSKRPRGALPIRELGAYIKWHLAKFRKTVS